MIQELLVMAACLEGSGCSQSATAYYISHPQTKETLRHANNNIREAVGPTALIISSPVLFFIKGSGNFRLTNYWSLQLSTKDSNMIVFRVNF